MQGGAVSGRVFAGTVCEDEGGIYIERALKLIENEMREVAMKMDDALFVEYWGESVAPEKRISHWLKMADKIAKDWVPSKKIPPPILRK